MITCNVLQDGTTRGIFTILFHHIDIHINSFTKFVFSIIIFLQQKCRTQQKPTANWKNHRLQSQRIQHAQRCPHQ